ncbi:MAG: glycoside hydrolase family 3 N-terminal domain-containing protein [Clostridia bacterium]|nr:glycoside hydrolase family 3 N-terminal domain-containing protein [Clostridia bacterium]
MRFTVKIAALAMILAMLGCQPSHNGSTGDASPAIPATPSHALTPTPVITPRLTHAYTPNLTPVATPSPTAQPTGDELLSAFMSTMTIDEKLGQLVMFGFSGTDAPSADFVEFYNEMLVGNTILYGNNISNDDSDGGFSRCKALLDDLIDATAASERIPMLISIDVEGGGVTRLKWDKWPRHAYTLGELNDSELAREQFQYIARGLLSVGINVNLAPCIDVAPSPLDTFLYKRIISSDAGIVSRIGVACMRGLLDEGCISFVKHYPGHGATTEDSHEITPVVDKTLDELCQYDLLPFIAAIEAGVPGVMVTHILYPQLDVNNVASTSAVLIDEILRSQLGFEGVVMSDDFRMAGLTRTMTVGEAAVSFINAGGDIILCGARLSLQREIMQSLRSAYDSGALTLDRIDESVRRVLQMKIDYLDWTPRV